jgi:hypothetical protein
LRCAHLLTALKYGTDWVDGVKRQRSKAWQWDNVSSGRLTWSPTYITYHGWITGLCVAIHCSLVMPRHKVKISYDNCYHTFWISWQIPVYYITKILLQKTWLHPEYAPNLDHKEKRETTDILPSHNPRHLRWSNHQIDCKYNVGYRNKETSWWLYARSWGELRKCVGSR